MTSNVHLTVLPHLRDRQNSGQKPYSDQFRAQAVARLQAGQPLAQVARELGVARNSLRAWRDEPSVEVISGPVAVAGAALSGSRREVLEALRGKVAELIDGGIAGRDMPANARLLMEITKELEAIATAEADEEETHAVDDGVFDEGAI